MSCGPATRLNSIWSLCLRCNRGRDEGTHYVVGFHETKRIGDTDGTWTEPMTVEDYVSFLGPGDLRRIERCTGANGSRLSARFAFLQVKITRRGLEPASGTAPTEWLVIEWRDGEVQPKHCSLCHLPVTMSQRAMVGTLNERWRIERIHEDLQGEMGFDHFEGRSWPGWQHHASLAPLCHALLVAER